MLLVLLAAEGVTILRVRTGAGPRQWLIAASLVAGGMLGFLLLGHMGHWLASRPGG